MSNQTWILPYCQPNAAHFKAATVVFEVRRWSAILSNRVDDREMAITACDQPGGLISEFVCPMSAGNSDVSFETMVPLSVFGPIVTLALFRFSAGRCHLGVVDHDRLNLRRPIEQTCHQQAAPSRVIPIGHAQSCRLGIAEM